MPERVNSRDGYRTREWDTWAGTVESAVTKLRRGSRFPASDLAALAVGVATSYLVGVGEEALARPDGAATLNATQRRARVD